MQKLVVLACLLGCASALEAKASSTQWEGCASETFSGTGYSHTCAAAVHADTCAVGCAAGYTGSAVDATCNDGTWSSAMSASPATERA